MLGRGEERSGRGREILALSALAIAQPLFDLLSRQSAFFVAHRSTPGDIVAFAAIVWIGIPLVLIQLSRAIGRWAPRAGAATHGAFVLSLIALLVLPYTQRLGLGAAAAIGVALLTAMGGTLALWRWRGLRLPVTVLAILSVAIPFHFLFISPVAKLVRPAATELPEVEVANPVPVVMLILDELPLVSLLDANGGIDEETYPGFAELARRSHWFRNATAVAPLTDFAVPALLAGVRPRDVAPIAAEYPTSLFTLLAGSHTFEVIETQTRLCPAELCGGESPGSATGGKGGGLGALLADAMVVYAHIVTPEPLSARLPSISTAWGGFLDGQSRGATPRGDEGPGKDSVKYHIWASDRSRDFERFFDRLERADQPSLHVFHAMLPHVPWVHLPSGREYWGSLYSASHAPGVAPDTTWTTEGWLVERAWQRHLAQVAYVDTLVARMLERLDATGLGDEALLVVVSDHGFSFRPGQPGRHPTRENVVDIMSVPLFVRLPGQQEGTISDRNVETIDVLPTIVDVLDIDSAATFDGTSAFSTAPERPNKTIAPTPAERLTIEVADLTERDASVARKLEVFAGGLFVLGPHPEILERSTAELPVGAAAAVEARLDQAEHYRDVDPDGPFVPAQVFGRVRHAHAGSGDLTLAVAVNGIVRAVTRSFDERGQERFVALVPEASFRAGDNSVEVFVVETASGSPVLHPATASSAPTYAIDLDPAGRALRLISSDGGVCVLDPNAVQGAWERQGTGFLGWAVDTSGDRSNVVLMVFADGRLVYTTSTGPRPDDRFADAPEGSGFQFTLPAALLETTSDLRLFAVLGERGTELGRLLGSS